MNKRILIVEDDIDIVEPLTIILESEKYQVEAITKGEQTYAKIDSFNPDVILLDILISGNDGRIICRRLKQDEKTKLIPIVMMSAHPGADKDAKMYGADDFIAKPFELDALLAILKKNIK